jgi:choline dehydrogenase-like flavoprotein
MFWADFHIHSGGSMSRGYDAIVVGAGVGGATLAWRLAARGRRVLVVDRADYLGLPPWRPGERIGVHYREAPAGLSVVGGQTKFYGAAMYRMRESDFRATRHEGGESPAWPVSYADLEPYYAEAERLYRVHGSVAGDPSEPPRSAPFPHPPLPHAPLVAELVARLEGAGAAVSAMPRALDYGPGGKCVLCATCDAYFCRLDAKMDAETAALRPALGTGRVELLTRAHCRTILTDPSGHRTTGILVERDGKEETLEADIVAICAGIGPSATLLLNSRTARHPSGLGNATGCVGRYYGGHDTGMVFPLLSLGRKLPPMHTKTFSLNAWYDATPDWPYPMGVIQAAGQVPFWHQDVVPWWLKPAARLVGERSIYCYFMNEVVPTRASGFVFADGRIAGVVPPPHNPKTLRRLRRTTIDLFRRAGYRVIAPRHRSLWHRVGTVRFGNDPQTSVLDANCRVHDIEGLYVVDASVLPSAGAVGTALTIAALALRTGDAIAGVAPARAAAAGRGG